MNREIKFRGQTEYNKTWVIGNLVIDGDTYYIYSKDKIYPEMKLEKVNGFYIYIVIKETVGQLVGIGEYCEIYEDMKLYDEYADDYCGIVYDEEDCAFRLTYDGYTESIETLDGLRPVVEEGDDNE